MARYKRLDREVLLGEALADAVSEVGLLQEEMQNWLDALDDNDGLRETMKHDEVEEASDGLLRGLEYLEGLPAVRSKKKVRVVELRPYGRKPMPRWMRLQNAVNVMEVALDEFEEQGDVDFVDNLRDAMEELLGVEFPGMF